MDNSIIMYAKDCVKVGDIFYFISSQMNLIFSINMKTDEANVVDIVPEKIVVCEEFLGAISAYRNNKLVIAPNKSNIIWIYDLYTRKWEKIYRKNKVHVGTGGMLQIVENGDDYYFVGSSYPAIIKLNFATMELKYIEEPFKDKGKASKINDAFFRSHHARVDNFIYLASCLDNSILRYDLVTNEYCWMNVGGSENRYSGIVYDGDNFWLAPRTNGKIVKWDGYMHFDMLDLPTMFPYEYNYFLGICFDGKKIILPNHVEEKTVAINRMNNKSNVIPTRYSMMKQFDNGDIASEDYLGNFVYLHKGKQLYSKKICISRNEIERIYAAKGISLFTGDNLYKESDLFVLESFIKDMVRKDKL